MLWCSFTTVLLFWGFFPEVSLFMTTAALARWLDSNQTYLWFPLRFTVALTYHSPTYGMIFSGSTDSSSSVIHLSWHWPSQPTLWKTFKMCAWGSAPCVFTVRSLCAPIWIQKRTCTFIMLWNQNNTDEHNSQRKWVGKACVSPLPLGVSVHLNDVILKN